MKKILSLVFVLILALGTFAAAEEGPLGTLNEKIPVNAEVGPYANVVAQRAVFREWYWFLGHWEESEPGMDFGYYTGRASQKKFADTNCFVVEANTALNLTFEGTALEHTEHGDSKMKTTYWAFESHDPDGMPTLIVPPMQIIPKREIGYFGDPDHLLLFDDPNSGEGTEFIDLPQDVLLGLLAGLASGHFYPVAGSAVPQLNFSTASKGIFAYQIFGFAGTDGISSQRAGEYRATITLTVDKQI